MKPNDDSLSKLLKNWQGIEPRASFEADVKRRIRLAEAGKVEDREWSVEGGWLEWLNRLVLRPAFLAGVAAAVTVSVLLGSSAAMLTSQTNRNDRAELQFMSSGTLAGGYTKLVEGGR